MDDAASSKRLFQHDAWSVHLCCEILCLWFFVSPVIVSTTFHLRMRSWKLETDNRTISKFAPKSITIFHLGIDLLCFCLVLLLQHFAIGPFGLFSPWLLWGALLGLWLLSPVLPLLCPACFALVLLAFRPLVLWALTLSPFGAQPCGLWAFGAFGSFALLPFSFCPFSWAFASSTLEPVVVFAPLAFILGLVFAGAVSSLNAFSHS